MGVLNFIGALVASSNARRLQVKRKSTQEKSNKIDNTGFKPYTQEWKNQHLKWASEGLCGECGAPSGEELGICDECRWEV